MSQEHFDMVVKNVKMLLAHKGWKASDLINKTNIDQPHMSKVLNGKARFTLDQIIEVADAFDVSVDFLIGHSQIKETSDAPKNEEIYKFFARLIENGILQSFTHEIEENAYVIYDGPDIYAYPYEEKQVKKEYTVYYFSNYLPPISQEEFDKLGQYELEDYYTDLSINGNDCPRNVELNELFYYYSKLLDAKNNAGLDEKLYQTAIKDHLDKLKY